jgi:twitching motility protein PilT
MPTELHSLLKTAVDRGASDIHLVTGQRPTLRLNTVITPMEAPVLTPDDALALLKAMASAEQLDRLEKVKDADFSYAVPGLGRFRVNAHWQRRSVGIAMRLIQDTLRNFEQLGLPKVVATLTDLSSGLVLVTGDTGSGKSTTLAAMIQAINEKYDKHVVTLEDPIEYAFASKRCLIEQRELGDDVPSFASGLRHVLRQDPDIILVGEMRDLETASAALTAAETGHLVLSTLHTINAARTVERIIDMYPTGQQMQARSMLAGTLRAVISQTLFRRSEGQGMAPAVEVMLANAAVKNLVRENRAFELPNVIETHRALGMRSLDWAIAELYRSGTVSREDALAQAAYPEKLERVLATAA